MAGTELVMGIVAIVTVFGSFFGIVYGYIKARNKERLSLIEKGLVNKVDFTPIDPKDEALKWGLAILGFGSGLFIGNILANIGVLGRAEAVISLTLIGGGVGFLVFYYTMQKKETRNSHIV